MRAYYLIGIVFLCLMQSRVVLADGGEIYRLRQGDGLQVSVWGESALIKELRVLPDGSITFPLAGRVEVANLSTPEAEKMIAERLKAFFPDPQVSVVVTSTEGSKVYILGKVGKPGAIPLIGPMTALHAISMVGPLDKFADTAAVKIIRIEIDNKQEVIPVDYDALMQGKSLQANVFLQPNDIIVVP